MKIADKEVDIEVVVKTIVIKKSDINIEIVVI